METAMKQKYQVIVEGAREVAGVRRPGLGDIVMLTAEQAEQPLRTGMIAAIGAPKAEAKPADKAPDRKSAKG